MAKDWKLAIIKIFAPLSARLMAGAVWLAAVMPPANAAPLPLDFSAASDPELVEILKQSLNQYVLDEGKAVDRDAVAVERQRLTGILKAMGYRAGQLREDPSRGLWSVEPGPLFRIGVVQVSGLRGSGVPEETLGLIGDTIIGIPARRAESGTISELERKIIRRLSEASFALANVKSRELVVDHHTGTVTVKMEFDPGPSCAFGDIQIRGARRGESDIVTGRSPFKAGEKFDPAKLLIYRKRLEQLGIFSNVRVEAGDVPGPEGRIPVLVSIREVPPDAEVLDNAAKPGALAATAALLAMALTLFVAPRTGSRRAAFTLYGGSFLILASAAGLAAQRVLQLAGISPF